MNMKMMKFFVMVFALLAFIPVVQAQDYDFYLQRVLQRIDEGDCEGAQKNYNVYKEMTGKTMASVEEMIADCLDENQFRIGNTINVSGENYIIAYLTENKQHGFAIKDVGINSLATPQTLGYLSDKKIPSLEEMKIIYQNNGNIGLTGSYWTRSMS